MMLVISIADYVLYIYYRVDQQPDGQPSECMLIESENQNSCSDIVIGLHDGIVQLQKIHAWHHF